LAASVQPALSFVLIACASATIPCGVFVDLAFPQPLILEFKRQSLRKALS
jgi:hypothetical protein